MYGQKMNSIIKQFEDENNRASRVACRMVKIDLIGKSVNDWLGRPASELMYEYMETAEQTSAYALNELRSYMAGEQLLDELGFNQQHERFVFDERIDEFRDAMVNMFEVMAIYFSIQEEARRIFKWKP